jgi:hypothetical protein
MAPRTVRQPAVPYVLEQLFIDQERDFVVDTIAHVLAWVPGQAAGKQAQPFLFDVDHIVGPKRVGVQIELMWSQPILERAVPGLRAQVARLRTGRTVQREHVTELAAYGLSFVAISVLMPGRRVRAVRKGLPPDLLFDFTPGALRGVETSGRAKGGRAALLAVRNGTPASPARAKVLGKAAQLAARAAIAEVHLSLWSASPRISIMEQIKP